MKIEELEQQVVSKYSQEVLDGIKRNSSKKYYLEFLNLFLNSTMEDLKEFTPMNIKFDN